MKNGGSHLNILGLGFAIAIVWGLGVFLLGIADIYWQYGSELTEVVGSIYRGFEATWQGAFLGLVWGLVDGFIGGVLIAAFYNLFSCCCWGKCKKEESAGTDV